MLPLAKELGIEIHCDRERLEPLPALVRSRRRATCDELGPQVGWYLDIGNIVNYGWPQQWVRILGERILKLDIKDFSRKKRNEEGLWKGFQCEIGEGDGDWAAVNEALVKLDWKGWATAEVRGGEEARLAQVATQMGTVLG